MDSEDQEIAGFDRSTFSLDFAASDIEKARRDVKKMPCVECFLLQPAELFGPTDNVCAECRGEK